jgi:Tol biopolymer transport system component
MTLAVGTKLGSYEILGALGAGGMGEVYRAVDTRLDRQVAIKVLPEAVRADPERTARFEREAKVLASLNHPHIAALFGLENDGGRHFLTMELVEGETLADRIARGPIPLDEALPIARQIAEALEAAHEQGIVHRDLKPANIKLRPDGVVKVLDFGLAKLADVSSGQTANLANSPTITSPAMMTGVGVLLGTAAYMSPEQAKGKPVDKRTDIWAFGCVLYEMLTAKRAFDGEDVSDTLAAVLRGGADWDALPATVPALVRALLQACLDKDVRKRVADVSTIRFAISMAGSTAQNVVRVARQAAGWRAMGALLVTAALASALTGILVWVSTRREIPASPVMRFPLILPDDQQFAQSGLRVLALSPDGSRLAYAANSRIYVRSMSDGITRAIPGIESESDRIGNLVFSPDGGSIAYFVATGPEPGGRTILPRGAIKRIPVDGGAAQTLCEETSFPLGISWGAAGILFGQVSKGVMRLSEQGGEPEVAIRVKQGEAALGPQILPGRNVVLFTHTNETLPQASGSTVAATDAVWKKARLVAQSLDGGEPTTIMEGAADGRYLSTGHVVYADSGTLYAIPFDVTRLVVTGRPAPVVEGVARSRYAGSFITGSAHIAVADSGTLAYLPGPVAPGTDPLNDIAWFGRNSSVEALKFPPRVYQSPRLSPSEKQVAVQVDDGESAQVWIGDLSEAGPPRQLTFDGTNRFPIWSRDGTRVVFQSNRQGNAGLFWQRADGLTPAEPLTSAEPPSAHVPQAWSAKGERLLYTVESPSGFSLWMFDVEQKRSQQLAGIGSSTIPPVASFSPDDKWIAYQTGEVPSPRVFVEPFPQTGTKYLAAESGRHPVWLPNGQGLFVTVMDRILSIAFATSPAPRFGTPQLVVRGLRSVPMQRNYDINADGTRVLGPIFAAGQTPSGTVSIRRIEIVLNWFEELKRRVRTN